MREALKHATLEDLYLLMDVVANSEMIVNNGQIDLFYSIVDELLKRGEIPKTTEIEKLTMLEEIKKRVANEQESFSPSEEKQPESWQLRLSEDIQKDKARSKRRHKAVIRITTAIASVIIILFLNNAVSLATGFDFLSKVSQWTKDAIRIVTGIENSSEPSKEGTLEYNVLINHLLELGVHVDLPTFIPEGFHFDMIDPSQSDDPLYVTAWFSDGNTYFSVRVKWIGEVDGNSFFEANNSENTESYLNEFGEFMVLSNNSRAKAIWQQNGYEFQIQGEFSKDTIIQMLDSIKK